MSNVMIELRDTTKRYGKLLANDHLNLGFLRGELTTLLGPSGCGKTTALRTITGQVIPDEGQVFIDGVDVTHIPTHRRDLGMVFQNFALFPHMTVYQNVEFPLMIRNQPVAERRLRVLETLRLIRMEEYEQHYPRQLSGGQQQRVGLARALVYRPKVLLLDEPLSNLDAKLREGMRFEIKDLVGRLGITAVYVTHDQAEALAMSDRVAVMHAGRIEQVGTPDEIYECPRSRFIADFIGLSNFLKGRVVAVNGLQAVIDLEGHQLLVPATSDARPGQDWLVFVRPNDVELLPPRGDPAENEVDGTVAKFTYLGDRIDYRVTLTPSLDLRVQTDGKVRFAAGERVRARLPLARCRRVAE
jgi:ABC-type Fe3+/spermidine/putrescine transport system ATPase subunit